MSHELFRRSEMSDGFGCRCIGGWSPGQRFGLGIPELPRRPTDWPHMAKPMVAAEQHRTDGGEPMLGACVPIYL